MDIWAYITTHLLCINEFPVRCISHYETAPRGTHTKSLPQSIYASDTRKAVVKICLEKPISVNCETISKLSPRLLCLLFLQKYFCVSFAPFSCGYFFRERVNCKHWIEKQRRRNCGLRSFCFDNWNISSGRELSSILWGCVINRAIIVSC